MSTQPHQQTSHQQTSQQQTSQQQTIGKFVWKIHSFREK